MAHEQAHEWEKLLGDNPFIRTVNLARSARDYREVTKASYAQPDHNAIAVHARQLQLFGQHLDDIKWVAPPKPKPQ